MEKNKEEGAWMKFSDLTNRLSEKQKERLGNAKTQKEQEELFTSNKMLLTEDQLGKVAGGSAFLPECMICGCVISEGGYCKNGHLMGAEVQDRSTLRCSSCGIEWTEGATECKYCGGWSSFYG